MRPPASPPPQQELIAARGARLVQACAERGFEFPATENLPLLDRVLLVSDFAYEQWLREPEWLALLPGWIGAHNTPTPAPDLRPLDDPGVNTALRRHRRLECLRLLVRDVAQVDGVEQTLSALTGLAEACLTAALETAEAPLRARYGTPRNAAGEAQDLVVFGMGKLGGGELNFSSDIDLIFAFAEPGSCDGAGKLDNEEYFTRLGRRLIQILSEVTADGFVYRVDMRLRPFGNAGRLALPFAAMEQYYQREGRDWERYAWIKARPVAGDRAAGARMLKQLSPFVYRRYLDYGAIDGLRELKARIDAEVVRRDFAEHIKLGPGGIRELEFMVQLAQLIRGGREPVLKTTSLLAALSAAASLNFIEPGTALKLRGAYLFLRRVENRLQMARDEQAHELPEDETARARLALGLDFPNFPAFLAELDQHRELVAAEFAEVLSAPRRRARVHGDEALWRERWRALTRPGPEDDAAAPADVDAPEWMAELAQFARSPVLRSLSAKAREKLERVLPALLADAAARAEASAVIVRLLRLLQAIAGRPSYLALLDERPAARERLVEVMARSAFLAERVVAHPLLLDELLDPRLTQSLPQRDELERELTRRLAPAFEHGEEAQLEALTATRQSATFRLGLAHLQPGGDADAISAGLAGVAQVILGRVLDLAWNDARSQYGALREVGSGRGLIVVGYGSLGGAELGFGSDLDLVFLYDAALGAQLTDGARQVEGSRFFARVAQRVVHWLTTPTRSGRLYEVDVRLRPDGAKGLLVTSLQSFAEYQSERAWMWEHQALVRARVVAGDPDLARAFDLVRSEVLSQPREALQLQAEVSKMRARWRAELDRSDDLRFDLKQGRGGLVDLEFALQALVLGHSAREPRLLSTTRTRALLQTCAAAGVLAPALAESLVGAHAALLACSLSRALDGAPRVIPRDALLPRHREVILAFAAQQGLD